MQEKERKALTEKETGASQRDPGQNRPCLQNRKRELASCKRPPRLTSGPAFIRPDEGQQVDTRTRPSAPDPEASRVRQGKPGFNGVLHFSRYEYPPRPRRPSAGCSFTLICTFGPLIWILLTSGAIFTRLAAFYPDTAVKYTSKPAQLYLIKSLCNCSSTGIESLKAQSYFFRPPPPSSSVQGGDEPPQS